MTIQAQQPRRLRLYEEPNGSFGTDHSGTLGDFLECPFITGSMKYELHEDLVDPGHALQHIDDANVGEFAPPMATASWDMNLETILARAGNDTAAAQGALGRILKVIMGGEQLGTGQTITGGSAVAPTVDASTGIRRGGALAFTTGSGGRLEARQVDDIVALAVHLKHSLSGVPAGVAYAAANYFWHGTSGDQTTSMQAIIEGLATHERYGLFGGMPTQLSFAPMGPRGIARISTAWDFANWEKADGSAMAADLNSGVLTRATYTNNTAKIIRDSEFRKQTNGTTTIGAIVKCSEVRFEPGFAMVKHEGPDGVNTFYQWLRVPAESFVEFDIADEDHTWMDHKDARDALGCWFQIGSAPTANGGGGILLSWPTLQVWDVKPRDNAITGLTVRCKLRCDDDSDSADVVGTVPDYNQAISRFAIALF